MIMPATKQSETRQHQIQQFVVTAEQMRQIEARVFAAGMPVAALMEKVAGLIARWVIDRYPLATNSELGCWSDPDTMAVMPWWWRESCIGAAMRC